MHIQNSRRIVKMFGNISVRILLLVTILVAVSNCQGPVFLSGSEKKESGITKGPMLLRVYQNRAAVMWETNSPEVCRVYYGKEGAPEKYIESEGEKVQYTLKNEKRAVFIHRVWLEGLKGGTVNSYQIIGSGVKSKIYRFRTAPIKSDRVRFIVYGDSRTRPEFHRKLVKLMIDKKVDFVVHGGDMVTEGSKYEQWDEQFFKPLKELGETIPIYGIKGNHEGTGGNYERLLVPEWGANNFGFDYGPVHIFCADNTVKSVEPQKVLDIITADMKNSRAQWKFVCYHRPSLNFGHHWSAWGYPDALERLSEADVDFVIAGHSHNYERFYPIAPATEGSSYVTCITSGGGGVVLSPVNQGDYHAKASIVNHFCLFDINGDRLTMDTIDIDGRTIDHLEMRKEGGRLNKEFIKKAIPMEEIRRQQKKYLSREN